MFGEKLDIRLPGPTAIPPEVQRAVQEVMNHPVTEYRGERFSQLMLDTVAAAQRVLQTQQDVLLIAGSGTSALETAMMNVAAPGDTVIVGVIGFFGEYFASMAAQLGVNVVRIDAPWGKVLDPQAVKDALDRHPEARAVFVTHSETSTSALNPVQAIGDVVKGYDAVLVVDAVSSAASVALDADARGLDMVVTGSQKGLMTPPGLALITVGGKAWAAMEGRRCPSFYLDLKAYRERARDGQTPFTPNIALINGLRAALRMLEAEGPQATYQRHLTLRDMVRRAMDALGLPCFVEDDAMASPTVTAVAIDRVDADVFRAYLRDELHIAVAGGLGQLKGKVARLAHMGYVDAADVLKMVAAVELAAAHFGYPVELGAGVAAAQRCWQARQAQGAPAGQAV